LDKKRNDLQKDFDTSRLLAALTKAKSASDVEALRPSASSLAVEYDAVCATMISIHSAVER
jgi:hypothetical protein